MRTYLLPVFFIAATATSAAADASDCAVLPVPDTIPQTWQGPGKRTVYLNFNGVTLTASNFEDSAITNTSAIAVSNMTIAPFNVNDIHNPQNLSRQEVINQVVAATRALNAPYDIEFTTTRPSSGSYQMVVFGGDCGTVAGRSCAGIALGDCGDGMPNNIVFVFPPGQRIQDLATTATHENAHAYGLSHTRDDDDIMYPAIIQSHPMIFGRGTVPDAQACTPQNQVQDSHQLMLNTVGAAGQDVDGPEINLTSPQQFGTLQTGSLIRGSVTDQSPIKRIEASIGDWEVEVASVNSFSFTVGKEAPRGEQNLWIVAEDIKGNITSLKVFVTVADGSAPTCSKNSDCKDGFECKEDVCVEDDGIGSVGETCNGNGDCESNMCMTNGDDMVCTQICDDFTPCPNGTSCSDDGYCFGANGGGGGGCRTSNGFVGVTLLCLLVMFYARRTPQTSKL